MAKKTEVPQGVEARDITTLKADPENPRTIAPEALEGLGVAVEEFGDLSGIVVNERTGELVAGHQRVKALRAAGATEWFRGEGGAWIVHPKTQERFPVRTVDWDRERQRMANLVANNPAIQGEFSDDLASQLHELEEATRFEELRLGEMLAEAEGEVKKRERRGLEDFDTTPAPRKTWILIATTEDAAAEIEAELRSKYEGPDTRIEVSNGVDQDR